MSSSRSRHPTGSPITEVPYDVLREIFIHCLPRYPLQQKLQPNTAIAPMLLCQVCSSWRKITLACPVLWSHLSYRITAVSIDPELGPLAFLQDEIDFILWWKSNQGAIAPFLYLEINMEKMKPDLLIAGDGLPILLKYVTSAQYLQVEPLWWELWNQIGDKVEIGDDVVFPNLHSLVMYGSECNIDYCLYATHVLVKLVLARTPSLLRRLFIDGDTLDRESFIANQWSALTHLSLINIHIPVDFWFSLVQAVPSLQWAYIIFAGIYGIKNYTEPPPTYTFPQLSTFFIGYNPGKHGDHIVLPFTLIFSCLYLPALQTLSLSSSSNSWMDHRAISELYAVLHSTPAVTTLALRRYDFLSLHEPDYPTVVTAIGDVEPVWSHTPHLIHLHLELPDANACSKAEAAKILDIFFHNIFSNSHWLALDSPACPFRTITLSSDVTGNPSFNTIRDLAMSSIQKRTGGSSNIQFKIIYVDEDCSVIEAWMEWGSRNY